VGFNAIYNDFTFKDIFYKISPCPSLLKRGIYLPLWKRGMKGDFNIIFDSNLLFKCRLKPAATS
jgi:hypothetical protein